MRGFPWPGNSIFICNYKQRCCENIHEACHDGDAEQSAIMCLGIAVMWGNRVYLFVSNYKQWCDLWGLPWRETKEIYCGDVHGISIMQGSRIYLLQMHVITKWYVDSICSSFIDIISV